MIRPRAWMRAGRDEKGTVYAVAREEAPQEDAEEEASQDVEEDPLAAAPTR
jgi:hypothetical protein